MDPITIAVLSASILIGLAAAGMAGLKAWNGWLELKKMELAQAVGDRGLPPASGRIEIPILRSTPSGPSCEAVGAVSRCRISPSGDAIAHATVVPPRSTPA